MNIYYVYAYLRSKDSVTAKAGTPYYIGKGKDKRAFLQHKTPYCKGVPTPDISCIVFLETGLTEIGSLALERRMIRWYGRKDLSTGILHNRTDGGDGTSGRKQTNEAKIKIGIASAGRIRKPVSNETKRKQSMGGKGLRRSPETCAKISAVTKGVKKPTILCPYCSKTGSIGNMMRWHFDKCKEKECYNKEEML